MSISAHGKLKYWTAVTWQQSWRVPHRCAARMFPLTPKPRPRAICLQGLPTAPLPGRGSVILSTYLASIAACLPWRACQHFIYKHSKQKDVSSPNINPSAQYNFNLDLKTIENLGTALSLKEGKGPWKVIINGPWKVNKKQLHKNRQHALKKEKRRAGSICDKWGTSHKPVITKTLEWDKRSNAAYGKSTYNCM